MSLQAIKYSPGSLELLDQLRLPRESVYVPIKSSADGWDAIKRMVVRGAPAIALVAALALAVELDATYGSKQEEETEAKEVKDFILQRLEYLVTSRPTAVNLADAARKLRKLVENDMGSGKTIVKNYTQAAEWMMAGDVKDNQAIGSHGASWILANTASKSAVTVLTHCNTGSLATSGYGTALGIIRSLHASSQLQHAYFTETRPYNQGSRLTAYELAHDKIPATLITDSMASATIALKGIDAIVVGADRVARNGDTANKIGTFQLAIVARYFGIKFVVAAPTTSVDMETEMGNKIVIEERPGKEVADVEGVGIFNPAFDVTPKDLIDAIVTEKGVAVKDAGGDFGLVKFF